MSKQLEPSAVPAVVLLVVVLVTAIDMQEQNMHSVHSWQWYVA